MRDERQCPYCHGAARVAVKTFESDRRGPMPLVVQGPPRACVTETLFCPRCYHKWDERRADR